MKIDFCKYFPELMMNIKFLAQRLNICIVTFSLICNITPVLSLQAEKNELFISQIKTIETITALFFIKIHS